MFSKSEIWLYGRTSAHGAMSCVIDPSMVDPLKYVLFLPVHHVYVMVHIKNDLLLIEKSSPCSDGSGFTLSLSVYLMHNIHFLPTFLMLHNLQ